MKKQVIKQSVHNGIDIYDLDELTYEAAIDKIKECLESLKKYYPSYEKFVFEMDYYGEQACLVTRGIRMETDEEFENRKRQEEKKVKEQEERDLKEYERLKAKYGNT